MYQVLMEAQRLITFSDFTNHVTVEKSAMQEEKMADILRKNG